MGVGLHWVLIANIIFIDIQRLTLDFRTALVTLLTNLRLGILLGPIAHIIFIHVQRFTLDFRTPLVTLLSDFRLIILLGLIATLSAISLLHIGLQDYRLL